MIKAKEILTDINRTINEGSGLLDCVEQLISDRKELLKTRKERFVWVFPDNIPRPQLNRFAEDILEAVEALKQLLDEVKKDG